MTNVAWNSVEIGAKSLCGSYGRFECSSGLADIEPASATNSVWPSAATRFTSASATMPDAPGRFSTRTGWSHTCDSRCATVRATMSGPNPTE
jgi:hypothetical protein